MNRDECEYESDLLIHFVEKTASDVDSAERLHAWEAVNTDAKRMVTQFVDEVCLRNVAAPHAEQALGRIRERMTPSFPSQKSVRLRGPISRLRGAIPGAKKLVSAVYAPNRVIRNSAIAFTLAALIFFAGWKLGAGRDMGSGAAEMSVYTTANGQRATITLPDGSVAVLNVGSRLEVPSNYGVAHRNVRLTGEAFFTVTHNAVTPFTVKTFANTTRVLGTSFVVRRYASDTAMTVAVREGKVVVGDVIVAAQQQVVANMQKISPIRQVSPGQFTFAAGVLTLEDMTLFAAIGELNRWYDAEILLTDEALGTQRLKGDFPTGSLSDLASILELTFPVHVVRSGRTLTLYPR